MIINTKTQAEIVTQMVEQCRDGIVRVDREEVTFVEGTSTYQLKGVTENLSVPTILSIESIEGIRSDGFYAHPTDTYNAIEKWTEGTDFGLSGSIVATAPAYAGAIAGETMYDYLVWSGSADPKNGSTFLVTYTYFDDGKVINPNRPTSFADGSIGGAFVNAFATVMSNFYNELIEAKKQSHIQTATGDGLRLHAENYNVFPVSGTSSSGIVAITNSGVADFDVGTAHRFTTAGVNPVIFRATEPFVTVGASSTVNQNVESLTTGLNQNVGVRTIVSIFDDVSLTSATVDTTVTNPGVIAGQTNLFNDGSGIEDDEKLRARTLSVVNKRGNATKKAIEGAVTALTEIDSANIFDWEDKKSIATKLYHVFLVGSADKIIKDPSIISTVNSTIKDVQPVGIKSVIILPIGVYIDLDINLYLERQYFSERTNIEGLVSTVITDYVTALKVGDDVVYSQLIENIIKMM